MLQVLLFTLIVGTLSAEPLGSHILGNQNQQENAQTEELPQSCADGNGCYSGPATLMCGAEGPTVGVGVMCTGTNVTGIPADCSTNITCIRFQNTNVTTIPAGAFENYPKLLSIEFAENSLQSIDKAAFRGLPILKDLTLISNELSDTGIGQEPFEGLSSLTKMNLFKTRLTTFPLHLFVNAKQLESFMITSNQINDMGPAIDGTFVNLKNINLLLNHLESLNASMFHQISPNLTTVSFVSNKISVIHDGNSFMDIQSLQELDISNNPIHCDCQASWMLEAREAHTSWAMKWDKSTPTCGSPKWMSWKAIITLYPEDLTCEPPTVTPITSTNISHTFDTHTSLTLQATMTRGFPYSTWVYPDGSTEGAVKIYTSNDRVTIVTDKLNKTDHSVVATLKILKYLHLTGLNKFTLVASNVAGATNLTFWVHATASAAGGAGVSTLTFLLMLLSSMVITG